MLRILFVFILLISFCYCNLDVYYSNTNSSGTISSNGWDYVWSVAFNTIGDTDYCCFNGYFDTNFTQIVRYDIGSVVDNKFQYATIHVNWYSKPTCIASNDGCGFRIKSNVIFNTRCGSMSKFKGNYHCDKKMSKFYLGDPIENRCYSGIYAQGEPYFSCLPVVY